MSDSVSAAASGSSNTATASVDDAAATPDGDQPDGVLLQQGKAFRGLMDGLGSATDRRGVLVGTSDPVLGSDGDSNADPNADTLGTPMHRGDVDVAAQLLAQRLLDSSVMLQSAAPATAAPDATFAELMEKHIKRALVSAVCDDSDGGEIHLELSDAVLPSTTLSLRRTADGWQLNAATANWQSRETLSRFAPALVARFAQSALGQLHLQIT